MVFQIIQKLPYFSALLEEKRTLLLRNLLTPALPKDKTFDDFVGTLKSHFEPKPARNCVTFGSDETVAQ